MTWFGGVVWPGVPAGKGNTELTKVCIQFHWLWGWEMICEGVSPLTSWASDHQQQIQTGIHGAGARTHPPPQLCVPWRWSWHPPPCLLWEQHWYPTSKWSLKHQKNVKNYIFRLSFPPPAPNQDVFCPSQGTARAGLAQLCSKHSHDHQKHSANAHWGLGSRTAHTPPSGAHGDAGQGCTLQKDLEQGRVRIPGAGIIPSTFWNSWH